MAERGRVKVRSFEIEFPGRPLKHCHVAFGRGLFPEAADWLARSGLGRRLAAIADETVAGLYGETFLGSLSDRGIDALLLDFPPGEASKSWGVLGKLLERLLGAGIGRGDAVVAIGGGVSGDLAGAAAALHCRGIPWAQMPTTTLSMADSTLGGKTAVNIGGAKNMAGAFHQPAAVFADLDTLLTLPERHHRAGLAEVVKTALVLDAELFSRLEGSPRDLLDTASELLEESLLRCAELKAGVVARDELEAGERAILNAGHTLGHAVEAAADGELLHGEAVAIGLAMESRLAVRYTGFLADDAKRLLELLEALGLPLRVPAGLEPGEIIRLMQLDKKGRGNRDEVAFALPKAIGGGERRGGGCTTAIVAEEVWGILQSTE